MSVVSLTVEYLLKAEADEREDEAMSFREIVTRNELKFKKELQRMFEQQKKEVLSKLDGMKDFTDLFMFDVNIWQINLQIMGVKHMTQALNENGVRVFNDLFKIDKKYKDIIVGITYDMEYPEALEFIDNQSYLFADTVIITTDVTTSTILAQGFIEGLAISEIATLIEDSFDNMSDVRAKSIARTEMARAANYGALSAYKQSNVVVGKEWLTAGDERVCPFCGKMDGVVIDLDDSFLEKDSVFTSGDFSMTNKYSTVLAPPLHPSCRCTLLPITKTI